MDISNDLPLLTTKGNLIVRADNEQPVLLRGINRSGMEYRGIAGETWTEMEFDRMVNDWGANILRIPLNQEWALARQNYDASLYLTSLDRGVEMAARRGAYTLLTLQWLDNRTAYGRDSRGRPQFVPPVPGARSADLWRQLAVRYREQPAVLYDIFTEPHEVGMSEWHSCARPLIEVIRGQNPAALVFVSGVNWGYDLRGHPIPGVDHVVYSTHVYRNKGRDWDEAFGKLSETVPVFAGEWGGEDEDVKWGCELAAYFAERNIGWAAWGWPDWPALIDEDYAPTQFGKVVRASLREGGYTGLRAGR
jgi:endoglucanase